MARSKTFEKADALDKALELFWSLGYSGSSMQDIVDHMGLSRSSIYDTFGDKRQLFLMALARYEAFSDSLVCDMLTVTPNAKSAFVQLFAELIDKSLSDDLRKGCFVVNTATELAAQDPEIAAIVQRIILQQQARFCETLARGQACGEIATRHSADSLARMLSNTVIGMRVRVRLGTNRAELEDLAALALSLL
jgi:TetR/AcrR family transcriptional regulator, transcriptional repressor for nem operon